MFRKILFTFAILLVIFNNVVNAQSQFKGSFGQFGAGYETLMSSFSGGTYDGRPYGVTVDNVRTFNVTATTGYNFEISQDWLIGLGAEYAVISSKDASYTLTYEGQSASGTVKKSRSGSWVDAIQKNSYNLFVSPGYVPDPDKLIYAKVGYGGTNIIDSSGEYNHLSGYTLGLGYKQAIADFDFITTGKIYAFTEINYANYGKISDGVNGTYQASTANILFGFGWAY